MTFVVGFIALAIIVGIVTGIGFMLGEAGEIEPFAGSVGFFMAFAGVVFVAYCVGLVVRPCLVQVLQ